jgi:hypothetical protein
MRVRLSPFQAIARYCSALLGGAILLSTTGVAGVASAQDAAPPSRVPRTGMAPKPHVGSAMAVLATLEQAQVLPPENSPEANQIIKSVIQFQSAFAKSDDRFLRDFADRAVAQRYGDQAAGLIAQFQSTGWTAALLEALAEAAAQVSAEELQRLAPGLSRFNLSTQDFHQFMQLVRAARAALDKQGLTLQQVFASYRKTMPGAQIQQYKQNNGRADKEGAWPRERTF